MKWKLPLHKNNRNNSKIWRKRVNDIYQQRYVEEIVLSSVYNPGATSIFRINNNDFILIYEQSNKVFHMPTDTTTKASVKKQMHHNLRDQ